MTEEKSKARLDPLKLNINSEFKFNCHKDMECFTTCCRDINIILTPYDIIRLKKRLDLPSDEFLGIYTEPQLLEKTDLPVVTLKMLDTEDNSCPFVKKDGCIIYEDRPSTCRYYPLGTATIAHEKDVDDRQGFYFFVNEPHCKGFSQDKKWTVKDWRIDQGVEKDDVINEGWNELIVMKRSYPPNMHFTEKAKELFFMVCYNLDKFKRFIDESQFIELHNIDKQTEDKIKTNEVELLKFGLKWLKWLMFKQGDFTINKDMINQRTK